jgi:sulfate transport system ATP-binding protein
MSVSVRGLSRRYDAAAALRGVDLEVAQGEFVALLGPSGSGKTTLLRILAGLEEADRGEVLIDGRTMAGVPVRARNIGFVFQHYALFRHMSVFENVAFGLRIRPRALRPGRAEIARRVTELLERVQIPELAARRPDQISGGQRQRAALARALAIEPRLLLLDEPFGALDAEVRKGLRRWLRDLHRDLGLTSIFVTHDQDEAMELADRVAVMQAGQVEQFDSPARLVSHPASAFVAGFLGHSVRLSARLAGETLVFDRIPLSPLPRDVVLGAAMDGPVLAFVRPHQWTITPVPAGTGNAVVRSSRPAGGQARVELDLGGLPIEAETTLDAVQAGQSCRLQPTGAWIFPA